MRAHCRSAVLDPIELQLRALLLGQGRRLFDQLSADHVEVTLVRALQTPGTTHLRYGIVR
jgi:hypothetical protein